MVNQVDDYKFGPHLQHRIDNKHIFIQDILLVLNNKHVLKIRGEHGATKFVLNKTRIKKTLSDNNIKEESRLNRLYKDGGLTVVMNESTNFIITAY